MMNVVVIVVDTLRADYLGVYGNRWIRTPRLNAFGEKALVFEDAYAEGLFTKVARRAMYTGKGTIPFADWKIVRGDDIQAPGWQPIGEKESTLAEVLGEHGYVSCWITDILHLTKPGTNFARGFGEWHFVRGQENDRFRTAPRVPPNLWQYTRKDIFEFQGSVGAKGPLERLGQSGFTPNQRRSRLQDVLVQYLRNTADRKGEEDYFIAKVIRTAMRWLEENADQEPFFLWIDAFDPHEPWDPPRRYADLYAPAVEGWEPIWTVAATHLLSEPEKERVKALYAGEVTLVDKWVGMLLEQMELMGLFERTLVVFTSDHGTALGEHGQIHKDAYLMHPYITRVPLLVWCPGQQPARIRGFVQSVDLVPLILGRLGIPTPDWVTGQDPWRWMSGEEAPREVCITASATHASIRTREWNLILPWSSASFVEAPRLYHTPSDPQEQRNVAGEHPEVVQELAARFAQHVQVPLPVTHVPRGED